MAEPLMLIFLRPRGDVETLFRGGAWRSGWDHGQLLARDHNQLLAGDHNQVLAGRRRSWDGGGAWTEVKHLGRRTSYWSKKTPGAPGRGPDGRRRPQEHLGDQIVVEANPKCSWAGSSRSLGEEIMVEVLLARTWSRCVWGRAMVTRGRSDRAVWFTLQIRG
jgi:hypothetical protein